MRILVIADIHANMTALEAVMRDAERHSRVDEIWCLGDIVGYGPDPCDCISLVREVCSRED
jgi:predicted phosphodiesterase